MGQVIVFASSKGGAGKTTAATVLACELAHMVGDQLTISLIDADPNQHSAKWAKREGCPANIRLVENSNESTILDDIEAEEDASGYILVDLEGTASATVSFAVSRADFVVIMCQGSQDDADEAAKTIKLINNQMRATRRTIPFAMQFTRASAAISPRTSRFIMQQFRDAGVEIFKNPLIDREAFRAMRSFGGSVRDLDPAEVSSIDKAVANANAYANELLQRLSAAQQEGRGHTHG